MRLTFCALCGSTVDIEHHHFVPKSEGGTDDETNLITLCSEHHGIVHGVRRSPISALTRKGLAWRKAMGLPLGSGNPHAGGTARRIAAVARDIPLLVIAGAGSLAERAARLNLEGYTTAEGKPFRPSTVFRMIQRTKV